MATMVQAERHPARRARRAPARAEPRLKKAATRRVRVPNVPRVAKHHGHLVVRHAGKQYVLVPLEQIERFEDEIDARDAKRISSRIKRGLEKIRPYEEVRRELGLL